MVNDHPPTRVGIVGATPGRGWAGLAHIPAIAAIPALALHAVATRHAHTAAAAADAFGARLAFGDAAEMIAHPDVEAVSVVVKAPDHLALVRQALELRKPVYCEWPLGRSLAEAEELAHLAAVVGVATAVGLQARCSPWLDQVRRIVREGRLGRILSTTLLAYDQFSTGSVEQGNVYMLDAANGANPLTIHAGHYVDALCFVLGELDGISATLATSRSAVTVRETGAILTSTSPDQIAISGLIEGGAVASIHIRAGKGDPSVLWEVQGERATLRVTSSGYLMWRPLALELWNGDGWTTVAPPDRVDSWLGIEVETGPAQNVAYAYAAFASDIRTGSTRSASFTSALGRHRTIAAIEQAAGVAWAAIT